MIIEDTRTAVVDIASNRESREDAFITFDFILLPVFIVKKSIKLHQFLCLL